jgi:hypothetical protein
MLIGFRDPCPHAGTLFQASFLPEGLLFCVCVCVCVCVFAQLSLMLDMCRLLLFVQKFCQILRPSHLQTK